MTGRSRLANRRHSESTDFEHDGIRYRQSFSRFANLFGRDRGSILRGRQDGLILSAQTKEGI